MHIEDILTELREKVEWARSMEERTNRIMGYSDDNCSGLLSVSLRYERADEILKEIERLQALENEIMATKERD